MQNACYAAGFIGRIRQKASEEATVEATFSQERAAAIMQVISERRSVRSFSDEVPARQALEQILAAGLAAPYAAAMAPGAAR